MKKITTLFTLLLLCAVTAMAQTTWESKSGWVQASGGKANVNWFGATTPGTAGTFYTFKQFQIQQEAQSDLARYIAIATSNSISNNQIDRSNVIGVSSNACDATATLNTYNFANDVCVEGGKTYYVVFLSSNTASNNKYTVAQGRIALNHNDYGTYTPGCQDGKGNSQPAWWPYFKATLTDASAPPTSVTTGWYQLRWVHTNSSSATNYSDSDVEGKYVANYAQDVAVDSKLYPLYLSDSEPATNDEKAKTFVYFDKKTDEGSGKSGNLRTATGRYVSQDGSSSLTAQTNYVIYFSSTTYPCNSVITSKLTGSDRLSLVPRGKDATPYIGQTEANKYPMVQFWPVNLSELGMEAWTVEMTGLTETLAADNAQVTYNGNDGFGVKSVYNGGTLFIATGVTLTENDLTVPTVAGLTPTVTVDADNHVVSLLYPDANYLQGKIDEASAVYDAATTGSGYGYPEGQVLTDLNSAIEFAQTCVDNNENLADGITTLQTAVDAFMAAETVKVPQPGSFIRLRSTQGAKAYLKAADAGTRMTVTTTADESTIFLFTAEKKLLAYKNGIATKNVAYMGTVGGYADADVFTFEKGLNGNLGGISLWATYNSNPNYLHSTGVNGSNADRNTKGAQFYDYNTWTVEDVTELPITLRSTDGKNYFATFSAPVNVQITGAALNRVEKKTKTASYEAVNTNELPAGVGVLLTGITSSATATIITNEVAPDNYGLKSYYAATAGTGDETKLYLGKGKTSGKAGFYKLGNGTTSNGFKAYLEDTAAASGEAKEGFELVFGGEVTGVETIDNGQLTIDNSAVYNLQGQRVNKAQKGVYIQNGKKVVLK